MADNIQFRVDAVLGNSAQVQNLINQINRGATLKINNTQALQSIKQVQQQVDNLKQSMQGLSFGAVGSGTGVSSGNSGSTHTGTQNGHTLIANQQFQTTTQSATNVQKVITNLNSQIDGTVSKLRLCTDETGKIVSGTAEITQGATVWTKNIEQARNIQGEIVEGQYKLTEQGKVIVDNNKKYNGALSQQIKMQFKQYAIYYAVSAVIQGIVTSISDTVNYAIDLNDALTNIRIVTMDTKEVTTDLLKTYNQMGQDLGANTLDIAEGAIDWLRQGYEAEEAQTLVQDSVILSKLALLDTAEATEYLTSALKGYKLSANDAIGVIDQLVSIDLEAATSAGDMAEAMSRTANMAKTTGFEMNELLGMIATMSEVTQNSASTIGNSVKTILSRMSNVKAGLNDFEGEALNDVEKTLNRVGIALRDNQGNWYDFYDVLDEVASKWDSFSDVQQSQITTALGGTRQRENVLVALENWDLVQKYAETGANSAGTAMEKYDIVLESVSAKQEQLNAKVQELKSNLLNGELIAGLLDIGKVLMDVVNIGDSFIGKVTLLTIAILALNGATKALKGTKLSEFFVDCIAPIKQAIVAIKAYATNLYAVATAEGVASAGGMVLNSVLSLIEKHPIIFALSALIAVVAGGIAIFDALNVSLEEQHEKAQEVQSDYEDIASELETVNSELETTQKRIDELNKKDKLSTVEKDELKKLKEVNAELEKRQYWLNLEEQRKKQEVTTEAKKAWDKDFGNSTEYRSRYNTHEEAVLDSSGTNWFGQTQSVANYITETEYIEEQIKYYGELEEQIDELVAKEGEWTQEEKDRYDSLKAEQTEVYDYLKDTGAKIQTDYLDSYDVDDETKDSWTELRDKIGNAIDTAYDAVDAVEDASNNLEAPTFDDVFSEYVGSLQSLTEQYEILREAQEEYNEYGNLSAETMQNIIDNGLLEYLSAENGQLQFNTQALQDNANATQNSAIAKLQEALFTDLQSIALGTYQSTLDSTNSDTANAELQAFQTELSNTTNKALETATAISAVNSALGTDYKFSDEQKKQADAVVANYNAMVSKVKSLSTNLRTNYNNNRAGSGGSSKSGGKSSSSKNTKEWWETQLETLKDNLDYDSITLDAYINGIENILGKLKKGSDAWKEVNKELQKAKLDRIENQFDRGEITVDQYIKKLTELRKSYKKNTEGYKELTKTINDAKYDKFASQYERGEITATQYIKKLQSLQNQYKKGSEEYKKLADEIDEIKLEKTEKYLDKLEGKIDAIDQKIDRLGDVNTDKESVKYAELLSQKYKQVQKNIASIRKQLKNTNLTQEQREALQERLNDLLVEEVDIRDEIEDKVRDYYENQKEQAEQQAELNRKETLYQKEVELYGKKGKELYEWETNQKIKAIEEQIELRQAEKEALDEINEREKLENDLLEAKLKLQNALNNKTTKILKKQADGTWQYEYSANMADVKSAKEEIKNAEQAIEDFDWEQGIQVLQDEADKLSQEMEDLGDKYDEAEFWADREYEQTMNGIEKAYGDIDAMVEKWMKTYGGDITKLTEGYQSVVSANNTLEQSIVNLTTAIESKYETVGTNKTSTKDGVKSFDTGGKIVGNGLILAHDKERVLTEQQNLYFESFVSKLPQLLKVVDVTKFGGYMGNKTFGSRVNADKVNSTVISKVECVFPNITSTDGLQKAILELPRLALQNK